MLRSIKPFSRAAPVPEVERLASSVGVIMWWDFRWHPEGEIDIWHIRLSDQKISPIFPNR